MSYFNNLISNSRYIIDKEGFIRYIFMDTPLATYDDLRKAVMEL